MGGGDLGVISILVPLFGHQRSGILGKYCMLRYFYHSLNNTSTKSYVYCVSQINKEVILKRGPWYLKANMSRPYSQDTCNESSNTSKSMYFMY